jgi:hypothetical protein
VYGVGEGVDVVPGEFLGEEVFHSSGSGELRKLSAVAESVG